MAAGKTKVPTSSMKKTNCMLKQNKKSSEEEKATRSLRRSSLHGALLSPERFSTKTFLREDLLSTKICSPRSGSLLKETLHEALRSIELFSP